MRNRIRPVRIGSDRRGLSKLQDVAAVCEEAGLDVHEVRAADSNLTAWIKGRRHDIRARTSRKHKEAWMRHIEGWRRVVSARNVRRYGIPPKKS